MNKKRKQLKNKNLSKGKREREKKWLNREVESQEESRKRNVRGLFPRGFEGQERKRMRGLASDEHVV